MKVMVLRPVPVVLAIVSLCGCCIRTRNFSERSTVAFYPSNQRSERPFFVAESVDGVFISTKQASCIESQGVIMIELIADSLESCS